MTAAQAPVDLDSLPSDSEYMKVGRFCVMPLSGDGHLYSFGSLFKKNLNVSMKVGTFRRHGRESGMCLESPADPLAVAASFWSTLASKTEGFKFDYAIDDVADLSHESGLLFNDMPCIVRDASAAGMFSDDGSAVQWPGVTTWYRYRGNTGSAFAFHREDMRLSSINFLAAGSEKFWYVVPPASYETVLCLLREDLQKNDYPNSRCSAVEMHKDLMVTPDWFEERGIPVNLVVQSAGQAVVVHPLALHQGFSRGQNLAFATNFGLPSWLNFAADVPVVSPDLLAENVLMVRFRTFQCVCPDSRPAVSIPVAGLIRQHRPNWCIDGRLCFPVSVVKCMSEMSVSDKISGVVPAADVQEAAAYDSADEGLVDPHAMAFAVDPSRKFLVPKARKPDATGSYPAHCPVLSCRKRFANHSRVGRHWSQPLHDGDRNGRASTDRKKLVTEYDNCATSDEPDDRTFCPNCVVAARNGHPWDRKSSEAAAEGTASNKRGRK